MGSSTRLTSEFTISGLSHSALNRPGYFVASDLSECNDLVAWTKPRRYASTGRISACALSRTMQGFERLPYIRF